MDAIERLKQIVGATEPKVRVGQLVPETFEEKQAMHEAEMRMLNEGGYDYSGQGAVRNVLRRGSADGN